MPQKRLKTKASDLSQNAHPHVHTLNAALGVIAVQAWESALRWGLADDGGFDWTTLGVLSRAERRVRARIIAKSEGVWAADGLLQALARLEPGIQTVRRTQDGAWLKPGQVVCEWRGSAQKVLAYERPFLNLASYVGGIAHRTAGLVERVRQACPERTPRVTATRKTLPGYRDLAICGVLAGGGYSHRVSLSGGVLIKENHIAAAGSIAAAVLGARKIAPHGLKIEIEVRNRRELLQALAASVDSVLLDNFDPADLRLALRLIQGARPKGVHGPVVEVSGGLHEGNIAKFAIEGVHILSVGSLTHSVKAIDLSMLLEGT